MTTITTDPLTATAPDLAFAPLSGWLASRPPDDDLARLADELAAAYAALEAERERGTDLRRRRAGLVADLTDATGADRVKLLGELVILDADAATVPAAIEAGTTAYALARLAYLGRLLDLADVEARALVAVTDGPLTALGKARHAAEVAAGYFGTAPAPEKEGGLRAEAARLSAALTPDLDRYRAAKGAADLVRARVSSAFGDVHPFYRGDYGSSTWETVAKRAGAAAADRARNEAAA